MVQDSETHHAADDAIPAGQRRYVAEHSNFKSEIKEMFFLDGRLSIDEAVWEADEAALGSLWQLEAAGAMRAASILLGQQVYYGTSADSNGFTGLRAQAAYVVALQSGGNNTNTTSAYLAWMDEKEGCRFDVGMDGQFAISPPFRQQIVDPNNSAKAFFAYVGNLKAWIGFNVMSNIANWAVSAIAQGTTPAAWMTDNAAAQLLAQIPVARRSNLRWFMNRACHATLQQSRSTINIGIAGGVTGGSNTALASYQAAGADGRPAFSPLPESCLGYPITLTDSILNTETN